MATTILIKIDIYIISPNVNPYCIMIMVRGGEFRLLRKIERSPGIHLSLDNYAG